MNKEEKEEIIKNAFKLGELVGTYGNKIQIEIFEWFINDWNTKTETVDKLQKENNTLKTTITKQSKDISEQLNELDKKDKVIDYAIEEIHSIVNLGEFIDRNIDKLDTKEEIKQYILEKVEEEDVKD